jgi:methylenetetrahydrofolate dehydrogenase (NADP+)/methenyltetrahydrofolate cyclohydrolase
MTKILKGGPVAEQIQKDLFARVKDYRNEELRPTLGILRVGEREDDKAYEARVEKNCSKVDMALEVVKVDNNIIMDDLLTTLDQLNNDPKIHGILVFRPLPDHLDEKLIAKAINPLKDIDCMHPDNCERIFEGDGSGLQPCTPQAVIALLKYYDYKLSGLHVVIVNRSLVLGKPLAMMLLSENATVTLCHSKTRNLGLLMRSADIVVTGVGKPKHFGKDCFTEQSCIIDVGINFDGTQICGDVDYEAVKEYCEAISPVPGGIGAVTSMMLLNNVIKALDSQQMHKKHKFREV